ncbi:MAG: NlpC/P60 family protein [Pseudomonadota bacterium]
MTPDRRFLRSNGRAADARLDGQIAAASFVTPFSRTIGTSIADLRRSPGGPRDKQLLYGQSFDVIDIRAGWAFGYDPADGYVGYVSESCLSKAIQPTHRVVAPQTWILSEPDVKSPERLWLSIGSHVVVLAVEGGYCRTPSGWVPGAHITPLSKLADDPVGCAERLLGVPYLWGGDSAQGIDCSGLTHLALSLSGMECPRDSDLQEQAFPEATGALQRGDLIFWRGHVAIVRDPETIIHGNAHHGAVAVEPFEAAKDRIAAREFGTVTKIARPTIIRQ